MGFRIKARDGPARICEFEIKKEKIITPNILFLNTSRFRSPDYADIIITQYNKNIKKNNIQLSDINKIFLKNFEKFEIMNITQNDILHNPSYKTNKIEHLELNNKKNNIISINNSCFLYNKKIKFIELIVKLKERFGHSHLLYLPTIGNLSNLSLFTYIGIDLFDCIPAILMARNNILMFSTGNKNINELNQIPCNCKYCKNYVEKPLSIPFEKILNHNYESLKNEIIFIRNEILNDSLRDLVEIRVKANTNSTALLRIFDDLNYKYIEERTPITRKTKLIATSKESSKRAEIKRFQERILKRYIKPNSKNILLLLPCSSKKPYSFSKSHKRFQEQLFKVKNSNIVHEMIITSPVGIVPRELELIYPASNYDIPVTHNWDEDEKKMILDILKEYLKTNHYDKIILHLPKNITDFILNIFNDPINTKIVKNPTSNESLKSLFNELKGECEKYSKVNREKTKIEDIKSVLSYQFDKKIAEEMIDKCKIKGKYPYNKIFYNNIQLGMITKERGLISLTMNGGERISKFNKYNVEIYDDFSLEGSVFSPGIKYADSGIRIGDEVVVIQNNKLRGVGVAKINGNDMMRLNYGEAVKIRHKV
jgi:archaeosine synthase